LLISPVSKIYPEGLFGTVGKESPICDHLISGSIPTSAVPLCPCCVAKDFCLELVLVTMVSLNAAGSQKEKLVAVVRIMFLVALFLKNFFDNSLLFLLQFLYFFMMIFTTFLSQN
jgi:hypothetical protein